jgi:MEMO1 family protein
MNVRPSPIAGMWYPGKADSLRHDVQTYLSQVQVERIKGRIQGLLVPHAGFRFSGQVAAHAFRYIEGMAPELVVVLSPHHRYHSAQLLTTGHDAYETPIGKVAVDGDMQRHLMEQLKIKSAIDLLPIQNDAEHAIEIELPFLQVLLNNFKLLPIMLRDQSAKVAKALGDALAEMAANKEILIVASSDLSHFYHQAQAQVYDQEMLRRVAAFDPDGVISAEEEGRGYACGRGAIAAMLWTVNQLGSNEIRIVCRATSGDVTHDLSSVVGYGAAVIWRLE